MMSPVQFFQRNQPVASRVVQEQAASKSAMLGSVFARGRSAMANGLTPVVGQYDGALTITPDNPTFSQFQGFAHPQGTSRAVHPVNQPGLAFLQGFAQYRMQGLTT